MRLIRLSRVVAWLGVLALLATGPSLLGCACGGMVAPIISFVAPLSTTGCIPPPRVTPDASPNQGTPLASPSPSAHS